MIWHKNSPGWLEDEMMRIIIRMQDEGLTIETTPQVLKHGEH